MSNINEAYPFEEQLLDQGTGLLGMVEDRNRLLKSMYRQDLFQDFLLAEKLQSLDDTGGLDVQPISRKGFDLSPVNEIAPNTIQVNKPSQQSQPKQMRQGGVVGNNPIIDMLPDSSGTYQPQTNKQTESLAEAGVTNDLTKVTGAVLEDFKLDDKLAKAFSESMALPARAAAVALTDLLSKISIPGSSEIVKSEVQKVSSAFNITPPPTGEERVQNEEEKVKTKSIGELAVLYGAMGIDAIANKFGGGSGSDDVASTTPLLPAAQDQLALPTSSIVKMGDGYVQGAPYTGTADGIGLGDGKPVRSRKKTRTDGIVPMDISFGDSSTNITQNVNKKSGFLGNLGGFAKKALMFSPAAMLATAGYKAMKSVHNNLFAQNDQQKTDLNELTNNVITENRDLVTHNTEITKQNIASEIAMPAISTTPPPVKSPEGGAEAAPVIELSPYFDEYASTSQFS
jgi:hypothetical protein